MARFSALMVAASTACLAASCVSASAAESDVKKSAPARVEATNDAKIKKITLTPNAAERLGMHPNTLRFRMKKLGNVRDPGTAPRKPLPRLR